MTTIPASAPNGFPNGVWSTEALIRLINAIIADNVFSGGNITGATINSSAIGGSTPSTGSFTTLTATGTSTLVAVNASGTITANGSLVAANAVALSPASHNVVLSPTGTGLVTINPATAGSVDNVIIGGGTPLAVHATTLSATGAAVISNASVLMAGLPSADPHVLNAIWVNSGVLSRSAG